MKLTKTILIAAVTAVALSGCRSSRHATTEVGTDNMQYPPTEETTPTDNKKAKKEAKEDKKKEKSGITHTDAKALTAKMNLKLESGKKKINVGGTYRLKRDKVVQINLVYTMIISINVGTMELTPDYILILDRMNKRYCKLSYSDVPSMAEAGIDFQYLQSVFWGEAGASPTKVLEWTFDNWKDLGNGQFPARITYAAKAKSASYKATFDLSNLKESDDWTTYTEIPSRYQEVTLDSAMKAMMNLTN